MKTLERICKTLGNQGGVLAQYDNEYIILTSAFGSWHKHCPEGKVLFIGFKPSDYWTRLESNLDKADELEQGFICNDEDYLKARENKGFQYTGMYLIDKNKCNKFEKYLILNDRY